MNHIRRVELDSLIVDENVTMANKPFVCGRPEENGGFILNMGGLWDYVVDDENMSCGN